MSIWERVKAALDGLSPAVPYAANVFLVASGAQLPDLFLVYALVSSPPVQAADNAETLRSFRLQISIFSRTGLAALPGLDAVMVAAGFSRGPQREIPYDQVTRHFVLVKEYIYLE